MSEAVIIKDATLQLRDRERAIARKHSFGNYKTYFDSDDLCFLMDGRPCVLRNTRFGQDIVIATKLGYRDPKLFTLHATQIVELQFASQEHIAALVMAHKAMGDIEIGEMEAPGQQEMEAYCREMDLLIANTGRVLFDQKIKNPLVQVLKQMGGEMIPSHDRLGQRVKYFIAVSNSYRKDKQKWATEVRRLHLLGTKK